MPVRARLDARPWAARNGERPTGFCGAIRGAAGRERRFLLAVRRLSESSVLPAWRMPAIAIQALGNLLVATSASAAFVFNVNDTNDDIDKDLVASQCETVNGTCTLRAAIMQANVVPNVDTTINLPAGTYTLTRLPAGGDGDDNGDLNLTDPVAGAPAIHIVGAGTGLTIIDGNGTDRVLSVSGHRTVTIAGVSVTNGFLAAPTSYGGCIANSGDLTLIDSSVFNCTAMDDGSHLYGYGGGIYSSGGSLTLLRTRVFANHAYKGAGIYAYVFNTAVLSQSSVIGNEALAAGGGLFNVGTLTIDASTLAGNSALLSGGAVFNENILFATNSTVSGNHAARYGGGIANYGTANVYNSTIAFNQADSDADAFGGGGGAYNDISATAFNVRNTLIAGNTRSLPAVADDCLGALGFFSKNKLGSFSGCSSAANGTGTYTLLTSLAEIGPLRNNGGVTRTQALVPPSNLIDGAAICADQNGATLTTDQRGRARSVGTSCDIGAFEYDPGDLFYSGFEP